MAFVEKEKEGAMSDSYFTLKGRISNIERKATKAGKTFTVARVEFDAISKFPKTVEVKLFGKAERSDFEVGDLVEITGTLGGREWNGRVFNDIVANQIAVYIRSHESKKIKADTEEEPDGVPF